jgi:hypothetical protein
VTGAAEARGTSIKNERQKERAGWNAGPCRTFFHID